MKHYIYVLSFLLFAHVIQGECMHITKVIIPAAGLGTRLLPLSKALPKEMIPVLDKPAMQYIIQEGLDSGITNFCLIMNKNKQTIVEKYFSHSPKLDALLSEKNRLHLVQDLNKLISLAQFTFVPQPQPLGLGHAVLMGKDFIDKGEYFGVFLPDDLIDSKVPGMAQCIAMAQKYNASVIAVEEVPEEKISSYGIVAPKAVLEDGVVEIERLVEKPNVEDAPSNLGIMGRYVLSNKIFEALEAIAPQAQGEIQLTDAIDYMLQHGERVIAYTIKGTRYDIGSTEGFFNATMQLGQKKEPYASILKSIA